MKLIGNLKDQVENANSMEEAKGMIEKAGMSLNDDELEAVTGGMTNFLASHEPYDMDMRLEGAYTESSDIANVRLFDEWKKAGYPKDDPRFYGYWKGFQRY